MRILLSNMGHYKNLGDRAILLGLVLYFKSFQPTVQLAAQGSFADLVKCSPYDASLFDACEFLSITSHPYSRYLKVFKLRRTTVQNKSTSHNTDESNPIDNTSILSFLTAVDLFFMSFLKCPLPADIRDCFLPFDVVIMGGGTQLETAESTGIIPRFIHNLVTIALSCRLHKRTYIFGQTIGPINNFIGRILTRNILQALDGIYLREQISIDYVRSDLKIDIPSVQLAGDCAFLLYGNSILENHKPPISCAERSLGICLRNILQKDSRDTAAIFSAFIARAVVDCGYSVYLYPQVIDVANALHDDMRACRTVYEILPPEIQQRVHLVNTAGWSLFDSITFLNQLDHLISMRMHPIIFRFLGSQRKHSFLAVSHIHKFEGLLADLQLDGRLLAAGDLSLDDLIKMFMTIESEKLDLTDRICSIYNRIETKLKDILNDVSK